MATGYKVNVFNLAGTTQLGTLLLAIPTATKDGKGRFNAPGNGYNDYAAYNAALSMYQTALSQDITDSSFYYMFSAAPDHMAQYMACLEMGCNLSNLFPFSLGTNGLFLRFNNGCHITLEFQPSGGELYTTVKYYLANNTLLGTIQNLQFGGTASLGTMGSVNAMSFPFVVKNADGTITDYHPRWTQISVTYYAAAPTSYRINTAGYTDAYFNSATAINLELFYNGITPVDMDDPYMDIPDSEPSGPAESTGIPENDSVDIPNLPTVAVSDTGFVTLFNPTLAQVKDLADYMWNGLFDVNNLRKLFADPMDCILGFNMLPVAISNSGPAAVTVGNISTGVSMNKATSQWVELDCGTLAVGDAFGNYLSYAPYTKFSIYLPYIGTVELSTDDVVGKTLVLKYHIDVLSCACVAYLKCGTSVLYQFTGSCGYSIPINGNDFRTTISSVVSIAASIGGAVATGGLSAPAAVAVTASTVNNVMNSKPQIHRSGAIGSSAGILGIQKPYLIVEYPNPCKPKKQYHFTGYPSFVTVKLSDISGYAAFEEILIEGVPCTEEEQAMIKNLCKEGIFL